MTYKRYEDPSAEENSSKYHSGLPCDVEGCQEPAGTAWSPYWCQKHNAERMNRISASFEKMITKLDDQFERQLKEEYGGVREND